VTQIQCRELVMHGDQNVYRFALIDSMRIFRASKILIMVILLLSIALSFLLFVSNCYFGLGLELGSRTFRTHDTSDPGPNSPKHFGPETECPDTSDSLFESEVSWGRSVLAPKCPVLR